MSFRPPKKPTLTLDASLVQVSKRLYIRDVEIDFIYLIDQDDLPLEVVSKIFVGSIHSAFNLVREFHASIFVSRFLAFEYFSIFSTGNATMPWNHSREIHSTIWTLS